VNSPDHWRDVVSAALVGTARRPPPPALGGIAAVEPGALGGPEAALLATAGVLAAYRRAGRLPDAAPPQLPPPAEPDPRPACSETATHVLELLLSNELPLPGGTGVLVGEWLAGALRAGCRLPARFLPRLLDLGATVSWRPALLELVGPRGRWLAHYHEPWTWAAQEAAGDDEPVERRFATAGRADRPAVLAALPPNLAAEALIRFLAGNPVPAPGAAVAGLLAACPGPWPESLAAAVIDRYIHLGARAGLELPASLSVLAERLDPSVLPLVETWAFALAGDDTLRRRVRTLGYALSLRAVIQQEFP
jgi:hypothetical protein